MRQKLGLIYAILAALLVSVVLTGCGMFGFLKRGNESKNNKDMSGTCGENLTYDYKAKTGKLTIKGTGEMTSCPWSGYGGVEVRSVEFEEGITSIYHGAFYAQSKLEGDIALPSTVKTIDDFAFYGTTSLNSVVMPEGVTYLGDYAFRGSGIKGELKLPDSITYIREECFQNCEGLKGSLKLPASLEKIGRVAFNECKGFTGDLVIPNGVKEIGDYAFANCTGLNGTLTLSESLAAVPANCFSQDAGFRGDLVIPDSVKSIGENAFLQCGFDGKITLPKKMDKIGPQSFSHCTNLKGDLIIPEGVRLIDGRAFERCTSLESLTIPEGVKYIGSFTFFECSSMKGQLHLPDSLAAIGSGAFESCTSLDGDLVIPDRVVSIGDVAFMGCTGMNGKLTLSESLLNIGENAFRGMTGIKGDLVILDQTAVIGRGAFAECSGIQKLTVGKNVTSMNYGAFYGCSALSSVAFTGDYIPDYFAKGDDEGSATFPEGITPTFGEGAKPVTQLWKSGQDKVKAAAGESAESSGGEAKEQPYYWTDGLRDTEFYGVGANADTMLTFDGTALHLTLNSRDGGSYAYHADANAQDNSIFTDKIWYKDGYLCDLKYYGCYRGCAVKATMVHSSGETETVYFVEEDYYVSGDISVRISLEEALFTEPF